MKKLTAGVMAAAFAAVATLCGCSAGVEADAPQRVAKHPLAAIPAAPRMPDMRHMRAVHATGNWGGNPFGFAPPILEGAPSISAGTVTIAGSVSSFTNSSGNIQTNDLAIVTLKNVKVGGSTYASGGFWLYRDVSTGVMGLQFRPQLDRNLDAIPGFSGDVNVGIPGSPGVVPYTGELDQVTGAARDFVLAVLAHAPELVAGAGYTLAGGSTLGQPSAVAAAMTTVRDALNQADEAYFGWLKSANVEWLGISVALHYDSYSDPTVVVRNCPGGAMLDSGGYAMSCAFKDSDLRSFVARARAHGLKIYLTLAFETSQDTDASPACGTSAYKMSRWWLGAPQLPQGSPVAACIPVSQWWWNPSHPDYAAKTAQFWSTYQAAAVNYAALSEEMGVDLYSLGTETENLFRTRAGGGAFSNSFGPQLQAMVSAVRAVYTGALTYDQHYSAVSTPQYYGSGGEWLFDDLALDVVGISAYFPLVDAPPTQVLPVAELEQKWEAVFQQYLVPLRQRYPNKPLVFTEVGYDDSVAAPAQPAAGESTPEPAHEAGQATPGMQQQANIYQAFFNVNARHGDLIAGAFWWGNDYFPDNALACTTINWSLNCRPAGTVVADAYAQWRRQDASRMFDWGAAQYPQFFSGPYEGGTYGAYEYRFYPQTQNYVGVDTTSGNVLVHNGREWTMLVVGTLRGFLDQAGAAGF